MAETMKPWRTLLGVLGGICIHLVESTQVIGTVYMSGNIEVYLVSYLRVHGESVSLEDAVIILPIQILSSTVIFVFGAYIADRFGPRATTAIGNLLVVAATFGGSFCTSLWSFCIVYALGFGIGDGISVPPMQYMAPLMVGWSYYPNHKGRVSGAILMCFALGSSVFNLVSTAIINPNNATAYIVVPNGKSDDHYYGADVADRFPTMMRWLAFCYFCLTLIGVACLVPIKKVPLSSQLSPEASAEVMLPSLKTGVSHRLFRVLFCMFLFSSSKC